MHARIGALIAAIVLGEVAVPNTPFGDVAQSGATASHAPRHPEPNDQRTPAGRVVNGELRVELDVVDITWSPPGRKGPGTPGAAFAERGKNPQSPGPLLRMQTGRPTRVLIRNALSKPVNVNGLSDRTRGDTAVLGAPAFMTRAPIVLAPGEEREVRFTPTSAVTSFYYGRVVEDTTQQTPRRPGGELVGAFVVDPVGTTPSAAERIFVINVGLGLTINGSSWPNTERLRYAVGDTVHWRVINTSEEYHPMHLHGFYFAVDRRGDAQSDTVIGAPRPLEVTEGMRPFSTMRMSWTAARAGNWLFHCHLLVHSQSSGPDTTVAAPTDDKMGGMKMNDGMAGLIMGITVAPRVTRATSAPAALRRLDLWTGTRPRVFDDSVGYGFVLQQGAAHPAPDSIIVPGSPLVLTRGEPTRIVVHNRLPVALGVHWHGMELQSYYDGVGHWSGAPGNTRAPIAPGDSMNVYITAPRAGTFMYHIHGETGSELQQGLYGALLVLEKGHAVNAASDRLFVLSSRGATADAGPAINGRVFAPAERFDAGKTYRLRLMHISTNDVKTVRLLKDGSPVRWRPLARDGATLPVRLRASTEAKLRMDVGQTFDFEWTPAASGVYVLEVATEGLLIGPSTQRAAFGVGPVPAAALSVAATGTALPLAEVTTASLAKLVGAYTAQGGGASAELVSVWNLPAGLAMSRTVADVESPPIFLMPLADGTFVPGTNDNGLMHETSPIVPYRIDGTSVSIGTGASARSFSRLANLKVTETTLARFAGRYENGVILQVKDGALVFIFPGAPPAPLTPISQSRFMGDLGGAFVLEFAMKDGKVVSLNVAAGGFTAARLPEK